MKNLLFLGIALVLIGVALIAFSLFQKTKPDVKAGGIILVGPIPIAFGSDQQALFITVIVGLLLIIAILFFFNFIK